MIEYGANFKLFYFKNHFECLKNLKKFINNLFYFKLLEDNLVDLFLGMFNDKKATLKVSQFRKRIYENFNDNLKKLSGNRTDKNWKSLFNQCCDYFKNEFLTNNIFFPIGGKYNINYYIKQLSNLIFESVKRIQRYYGISNPEKNNFIFSEIIDSLKFNLKKLQLIAVEDLCELEYVHKHLSKLLETEVETLDDYIKIERMVCDFYNMFVYIISLYQKSNKKDQDLNVSYSYFSPIVIDNYDLKIIEGIEIRLNLPTRFVQIKGFDDKGKEVIMEKDTDYFIDEFLKFYCPSEVLEMKNIYEIEVISSDERNNKRFKVNEYLSV